MRRVERSPRHCGAALCFATCLFSANPSLAADAPLHATHALKNSSPKFLVLETLGIGAVFAVYSLAAGPAPRECAWCAPTGFDVWVRDRLVVESSRPPATVSHVLSYGVIPLAAAMSLLLPALNDGSGQHALQDIWIAMDGLVLTLGVSQGTKRLTARRRPAFYYGREADTEYASNPSQANLSFFSGDTAAAFSLAASATTLAYLRGYAVAPWLAVGGGMLATGIGVLRIAADMHWATDVLAGAVVGSAVGTGLPLLLHQREGADGSAGAFVVPLLGGGVRGVLVSRSW